jgi:hypothetical protein
LLRFLLLSLVVFMFSVTLHAQVPDSPVVVPKDTVRPIPPVAQDTDRPVRKAPAPQEPVQAPVKDTATPAGDSIIIPVLSGDTISWKPSSPAAIWQVNDTVPLAAQIVLHHPYFKFNERPMKGQTMRKKPEGKETLFYMLTALLFVFALIRQSFGKYFSDLFRVFFQTTLKQRQIREQLMQNPFPSLVFNIFFVASAGLYINFMLHYFGFIPGRPPLNFWILYLYCCIGLAVIYLGKFIGLKIVGWLFNMRRAADSYTFIVFIINKVIGIFLVPFLILLAFAQEPLYTISLVVSWCGLGALILYRFILGFGAIRNEVRFNLFHFFLYLCAFEIIPLLLIYKLLLVVF